MRITSDFRPGGHDSDAAITNSSQTLSGSPGSGEAKFVAFQADHGNAGTIHIMYGATATTADGWALAAGESTPWLPAGGNISEWRAIGSAGTQALRWMWMT